MLCLWQDTLSAAKYILVQLRKTSPNMTEKLLTGIKSIRSNKQKVKANWDNECL